MRSLNILFLGFLACICICPAGLGAVQEAAEPELEALEAAIFAAPGGSKVRVGEEIRLKVETPGVNARELQKSSPGGRSPQLVWQEELRYPGASYIAPHFSRFDLPGRSFFVVRAPDRSRSWVYRGLGKANLGRKEGFWGIHIAGDTAILELWADRPLREGAVQIDSFAHGYPESELAPVEKTICGTDNAQWAACWGNLGPDVYSRSRPVARLLVNGIDLCTGWLFGDEGHVMTNEHCIGNTSEALNTNFEFMAEGTTCPANCASALACPGTVAATSSTLIRVNASLDYSLVKLPTNPSSTYGFLEMRSFAASQDERIYIPQHPRGWGKRVAVNSTHSSDASGFCEINSLSQNTSCRAGSLTYFCDTEGGSSGSPVIAQQDHRVVALHQCGGCPNGGIQATAILADLGSATPRNATGGSCGTLAPTVVSSGGTSGNTSTVTCPAGTLRIGGGCTANSPGSAMNQSFEWNDFGWACSFASQTGTATSQALCAPISAYSCRVVVRAMNTSWFGGNVVTATCPASKVVVGGGCSDDWTATASRTSRPSGNNAWTCQFQTNPGSLTAYAYCADPAPGLTIQTVTATTSSSNQVAVSCPAGKRVLGGGCSDDLSATLLQTSTPSGTTGWTCTFQSATGSLTAYAICE
jgi:hypothetical protein